MLELLLGLTVLLMQAAHVPSLTFDPTAAHSTNVHWSFTLSAPFCGGFRIGDGVYIKPEAPLALPATVPSDAVLFDAQPAAVTLQDGVLRVLPSRTLAQPMLCTTEARPFTVELLSSLGLANPDPGEYAVDVWFGSGNTPLKLPVTIDAGTAAGAQSTGCDALQQRVDEASARLDTNNTGLSGTFDLIRAQTAQLTLEAPGLAETQNALVRQLDQVQAAGKVLAADGWNPSMAYAEPVTEWAQGAAQTDLAMLQSRSDQADAGPQPTVARVISLLELAQQQAQTGDMDSQQLADALQQLGDCGRASCHMMAGAFVGSSMCVQALHRLKVGMLLAILGGVALAGPLPVARAVTAAPSTTALAAGPSGNITTWSVQTNSPEWNRNLGVTATRQGCSSSTTDCINLVRKVAQTSNVRATLAVPLNATNTADNALQFSQLSLNAPFLVEVGIDDFVSQYKALFAGSNPSGDPAALLSTVIANLKSANPNLSFGATIYEDELTSPYLQDARLPSATRGQFDYVHLFIHYRQDGPLFERYVQQASQLFPNAHIIGGSYAVDRRAFLPCAPGGQSCTTQQDFDLFTQSLTIQAQLLVSGEIDSIEFFPGYFGNEEQWPGLNEPRECAPGDQANCIANTRAMRQAALKILGSGSPPNTTFNEVISTLAGTGGAGYSGDNGAAASAQIFGPSSIAVDQAGNVYVVDAGNYVVRKVDAQGVIRAFAGDTTGDNKCGGGAPTQVGLDTPQGVAVDSTGNVYIADPGCAMVFEVDVTGKTLTTVAGGATANLTGDGGPATQTLLQYPVAVAADGAGTVYIADSGANTVRTVDRGGLIHTLAGNGNADYTGDGGAARSAALSSPEGIAVDRAGNVYIADFGNNVIRQVDTSGVIHTFAGNGTAGYAGDEGPAASAQLLSPQGVAVDNYGSVYIADTGNNVIRNVDSSHTIHTFAGNGTGGFGGDGGPAAAGQLAQPAGVTESDAFPHPEVGSVVLYVADTVNNRVREINTPAVHVATGN
jgi:sugar lactone lactonase YvrE